LLFIFALTLTIAAPIIAKDIQRDKDEEAVQRGKQYKRALRLYYKKFHAYPTSISQLENTNDIRFLRKRYLDPITGKDDWRIIHVGEAKVPILGFFGQPLQAAASGLPPVGINGVQNGAQPGTQSQSPFFNNGPSNTNGSSSPFGSSSAFGSSSGSNSFGSSNGFFNSNATDSTPTPPPPAPNPASDQSASDASQPNGSENATDGNNSSDNSVTNSSTDSATNGTSATNADGTAAAAAPVGVLPGMSAMGGVGGVGGATGASPGLGASTGAFGGSTGGFGTSIASVSTGIGEGGSSGPIVGFGLPVDKKSIVVYHKQTSYNKWEFTYDPMEEQMYGSSSGIPGAAPIAGSNGTAGTGATGSSGFGAPGSGSYGNSGGSGFGSGFGSQGAGFGSSAGSSPAPGPGTASPN